MFNFFKKSKENKPLVFCKNCKYCAKYADLKENRILSDKINILYKMAIYIDDLCEKTIKYETVKKIDYYSTYEYTAISSVDFCNRKNKRNDCESFEQKSDGIMYLPRIKNPVSPESIKQFQNAYGTIKMPSKLNEMSNDNN